MLSISSNLQTEQEKQVTTPRVGVRLDPLITHAKNMGASVLELGSYFVTGRVTNDYLYVASGASVNIYLNTYGLSDLFSMGITASPTTQVIANAFASTGWGIALSLGTSSVFVHYVGRSSAYGASNPWVRREYTSNGVSFIGTSNIAQVNNPFDVPIGNDGAHVPFINVIDDTLWATTHSRDNVIGGTYRYDVFYSTKQGSAWPAFSRLDIPSLHYRSTKLNNENRDSYLNVHPTGRYPSLFYTGISGIDANGFQLQYQTEFTRTDIWGKLKGNIEVLHSTPKQNIDQSLLSPNRTTITELSGISQTFLSVDFPDLTLTSRRVFSRTWAYRSMDECIVDRNLGASAAGDSFNVHTLYYRGLSFIFDINIKGVTFSSNGTSAAITNYMGITDFNVISYQNSNNSNFEIEVANVY